MAKPSDLVLWVPGAEPSKMTSPSGSKRNEGWVSGEKPAFQTMNYLQNNWGQWLSYFETTTDDNIAAIALNTAHRVDVGNPHGTVASEIVNDSSVAGAFVDDALDGLDTAIGLNTAHRVDVGNPHGTVASEITNDSSAAGAFVDDALDLIVADVTSYTFVNADISGTGGFSNLDGFIKWHTLGKKIYVIVKLKIQITTAPTGQINVDVVTNTSLPSGAFTNVGQMVSQFLTASGEGPYQVTGVGLNNLVFSRENIAALMALGTIDLRGSFIWQLP